MTLCTGPLLPPLPRQNVTLVSRVVLKEADPVKAKCLAQKLNRTTLVDSLKPEPPNIDPPTSTTSSDKGYR